MHRKYFSTNADAEPFVQALHYFHTLWNREIAFCKMRWAVFSHMFRFCSSSWSIFQPLSSSGVQACFTYNKNTVCMKLLIFAQCVSPKSGHKRDVRCKGGSYVVHSGIRCQWKEIESSFTWKYKNWPDPVYWGIEDLAGRACLVKDLKIKMGRIRNVRSRSSGQLLESEGFACFCHSLPTKSNGNGSWRDCYRFSYKRKENVMYNV